MNPIQRFRGLLNRIPIVIERSPITIETRIRSKLFIFCALILKGLAVQI